MHFCSQIILNGHLHGNFLQEIVSKAYTLGFFHEYRVPLISQKFVQLPPPLFPEETKAGNGVEKY